MTQKETIGLIVIILLFVILAGLLFLSWPRATETRKLENNVLVEQRMINLNKSR